MDGLPPMRCENSSAEDKNFLIFNNFSKVQIIFILFLLLFLNLFYTGYFYTLFFLFYMSGSICTPLYLFKYIACRTKLIGGIWSDPICF